MFSKSTKVEIAPIRNYLNNREEMISNLLIKHKLLCENSEDMEDMEEIISFTKEILRIEKYLYNGDSERIVGDYEIKATQPYLIEGLTQVSFSIPSHDWKKLKMSDEWNQVAQWLLLKKNEYNHER